MFFGDDEKKEGVTEEEKKKIGDGAGEGKTEGGEE